MTKVNYSGVERIENLVELSRNTNHLTEEQISGIAFYVKYRMFDMSRYIQRWVEQIQEDIDKGHLEDMGNGQRIAATITKEQWDALNEVVQDMVCAGVDVGFEAIQDLINIQWHYDATEVDQVRIEFATGSDEDDFEQRIENMLGDEEIRLTREIRLAERANDVEQVKKLEAIHENVLCRKIDARNARIERNRAARG